MTDDMDPDGDLLRAQAGCLLTVAVFAGFVALSFLCGRGCASASEGIGFVAGALGLWAGVLWVVGAKKRKGEGGEKR
jgi:hypothetical protein